LLLHGSVGTGAIWRGMIRDLQPLYRAVAPDLIGYGKSTA
jgi:pimeloyl-ACP methyl ester carboxylesterase